MINLINSIVGRLIDTIKYVFHDHEYEPITSIYHMEDGTVNHQDTICKCKVCGKKETFRKNIKK